MEDEKFKDLLEDEELKSLRLAALATKQIKQQSLNVIDDSSALPINSIITPKSGPESASNQIPFVQTERNAYNNNYSWRKQNPSLRRRGGGFPKSNQRSNLIVINPIAPNEGKDIDKNVPSLVLPQHKWCNSGNEDSMSPKTLRRTGPTRFNRHGSDSESSESDLENDIDSGSNETVLQDEPPEHFSHLSSDSDTVPECVEKKRRLSFQNFVDSDIACNVFDKNETTCIYNVLKNPSNNESETFASGQNASNVRQSWNHSTEKEFDSYKHHTKEHHQRDTSENFAKKQMNSSLTSASNGESHIETNRIQPFDKSWSHSDVNSYYSRETAYNSEHGNTNFNDKSIQILSKDDLRFELQKRVNDVNSSLSDTENQNGTEIQTTVWNRNRSKNTCLESKDVSYSNAYGNENEHSNLRRNRQNLSHAKNEHHTSLSHGRHQRSSSAERNKHTVYSDKDKSNFDYSSGPERSSRYDSSPVNDQNRQERNSSRDRDKSSLDRSWYKRSTSRDRHEQSSSKSRRDCKNMHQRSSSRNRHERSGSRSRHERSSSNTRCDRSSSGSRHDCSSSRTRPHNSSRTRLDRSSSRTRRDRSSSRTRRDRSSSRTRRDRSSSRTRCDRSSSRTRHDRSSSRTRRGRSSSRTRYGRSSSRTRCDRSFSRTRRDQSSSRSRYDRSSSRSSQERSLSRSKHDNSSSRDLWKNERSTNEGGITSPSKINHKHSYNDEKEKYYLDEGKSDLEYSASHNRKKLGDSQCNDKLDYGVKSGPGQSQTKDCSRQESSKFQAGKFEQDKSCEKRKDSNSSRGENVDEQITNEKKNNHTTLKATNIHSTSKSVQRVSKLYAALNEDKKSEKTTKLEKSHKQEKSKSIEKHCSSTDESKRNRKGRTSHRRSSTTKQFRHSRSRSISSTSSSSSSSSLNSRPKIRSVSSVIKSVQPKKFDIQNKLSFEIKSSGKNMIVNTSQSGVASKKNVDGDHNRLSVIKSSRIDVDFKACDNSKRVPVHMRLGVLPRKRVIQMPKDVEAAFVNSSSSSDGENVNTKCKRQNIRIVTDVTTSTIDYEKHQSGKEKSPKRSSPDLHHEKSKRLKIKR